VQANVKDGRRTAVGLDTPKFFDMVDHDVLMNLLWRTIADKRLPTLIVGCLRARDEPEHKAFCGRLVPGEGPGLWPGAACKAWSMDTSNPAITTPQGGPISALLVNIPLHHLDRDLQRRVASSCVMPMTWSIWSKSQRARAQAIDANPRIIT